MCLLTGYVVLSNSLLCTPIHVSRPPLLTFPIIFSSIKPAWSCHRRFGICIDRLSSIKTPLLTPYCRCRLARGLTTLPTSALAISWLGIKMNLDRMIYYICCYFCFTDVQNPMGRSCLWLTLARYACIIAIRSHCSLRNKFHFNAMVGVAYIDRRRSGIESPQCVKPISCVLLLDVAGIFRKAA